MYCSFQDFLLERLHQEMWEGVEGIFERTILGVSTAAGTTESKWKRRPWILLKMEANEERPVGEQKQIQLHV